MTVDTVFDMASITKPVATATSILMLMDQGKLSASDLVIKHLPEFAPEGKDRITVLHLLTHQGGLIPDNALADYQQGPDEALKRIHALGLRADPGTRFIYTDVGFIVLGELVRRLSGQDVHQFTRERLFGPLGMRETGFLPSEELRRRAAPTEQRDGRWIQGEVHDPRSYLLGGVAGHAGLFSTAEDLAVYAQMMLGQGEYGGVRVLSSEAVDRMTTPQPVSSGLRGLGWDMRTGYSSNRGQGFSDRAFGHGGFTGTTMWIDPGLELVVIFLSNRLHPDGKGSVNPLAGRIGTLAAEAIEPNANATGVPPADQKSGTGVPPVEHRRDAGANGLRQGVLTGIDVLARDGFKLLQGRRVGLITNHTGMNAEGLSTVQLLAGAPGVKLVALFSPEHGFEGKLDVSKIGDASDAATGLPVYSLYGEHRKPTRERLAGIDTLVFDIQDIGARFYTYNSTMAGAMEAAAEHGLRFVVLDRPNPIGGVAVEGPVLDAGRESFVGFHAIPVRHGMTSGELARLYNQEKKLGADLHVVRVEGWRRSELYDATGLEWINPSPNMRSLTQAVLYPGIGLLETTNLSVGRGTDTPFELFGAPWIDGRRLARELNQLGLPGVRFVPIRFTPESSKFKDQPCRGVNVIVVDRAAFGPVRTGLAIAVTLRRLYPRAWEVDGYARLLSSAKVLDALRSGRPLEEIESLYQEELARFHARRRAVLLYEP
jgi:uncharacterized protein YbbC (DUF1343 family)